MEKIQDYGVIGNGRSAALVSRHGSIDWLCWPQFDSPSFFGRILDQKKGGFWEITCRHATVERRYIEDTNVLETVFKTKTGMVLLRDFMTAMTEKEKTKVLLPEHELIREVVCLEGEVEINISFNPKPEYGKKDVKIHNLGKWGSRIELGKHLFTLRCSRSFSDQMVLKKGESIIFSLTYTIEGPSVISDLNQTEDKLDKTIKYWQKWCQKCTYQGPYRKEVIRSALALKLLNFAPSGAFIAAPTTSLPERIGGDLNWDYRFCWLRDASFIVHAFLGLGFKEEAEAFVSWLLHSTRLTLPELRVLYDVYGNSCGKEKILNYLSGYKNSYPVRIGNEARTQKQLDIYGEVVDAVFQFYHHRKINLDGETKKMLTHIGKYVTKHWREADNGIWEYREEQKHYTHSRLMCWVALDRLIELNKTKKWLKHHWLEKFIENRDLIATDIENDGWNETIKSYTSALLDDTVDASTLLFSYYKFEDGNSERMNGTYKKIMERLYNGNGLIYRSEKGVESGEGAFAMCCFWHVEFLARRGDKEKSMKIFNTLISYANDLGLYSEEIDFKTGDFLGNFPQAFTHVGLINAALLL